MRSSGWALIQRDFGLNKKVLWSPHGRRKVGWCIRQPQAARLRHWRAPSRAHVGLDFRRPTVRTHESVLAWGGPWTQMPLCSWASGRTSRLQAPAIKEGRRIKRWEPPVGAGPHRWAGGVSPSARAAEGGPWCRSGLPGSPGLGLFALQSDWGIWGFRRMGVPGTAATLHVRLLVG